MYIKSLSLVNIRSYVLETITFPKGTILLSGDIGSGKSTILQGIEFALFGIIRGELSGSSLLRYGAKKGSVTLCFVLDNHIVTVTRGLHRSQSTVSQTTGTLDVDGVLEELSAQELTNRVFGILAYPAHYTQKSQSLLFRYTVYTSQEKMKEILFDSPETRLQTLRALFGVEKYKTISASAQVVQRELRVKKAKLEGEVTALPTLQLELHKLKDTHQKLTSDKDAHTVALEKQRTVVATSEAKVQSFEKDHDAFIIAKEKHRALIAEELTLSTNQQQKSLQLAEITTNISDAKIQLQKLPAGQKHNIEVLLKQKDELQLAVSREQNRLFTVKEKRSGLLARLESVSSTLSQLQKRRGEKAQLEKEIENLRTKMQSVPKNTDELQKYQTALEALAEKRGSIKARIVQYDSFNLKTEQGATCPTCLQVVTPEHISHIMAQTTQKKAQDQLMLTASEKTAQGLVAKIAECQKATQLREQYEKELSVRETKLSLITTELEKESELNEMSTSIQKEIAALPTLEDAQLTDLQNRLKQQSDAVSNAQKEHDQYIVYEKNLAALQHLTDLQERVQEEFNKTSITLTDLRNRIIAVAKSVERFSVIEKTLNHAKIALKIAQESFTTYQNRNAELTAQLAGASERLSQLTEQITLLVTKQQRLQNANTYRQWIQSSFVPLMETLERSVFTSAYQECEHAFSRWFSILLPDEALHAKLDEQFTPVISQDGYETSLEFLSGGEKTSIALVYRLALNHVINQVVSTIKTKDLLILDEPTDGFSFEQLDRVKEVLDQLQLAQLIIVSHEQKVESFVDSIIRVTKQHGISTIAHL